MTEEQNKKEVQITDPQQDLKNYSVDKKEMMKLMKKYKKIKKYMKSPMYQIKKLSGKRTLVDELIDEYNQNPE